MAQLLRVCKPEICSVVRSYGTQRHQQNHYETLNISPDASQRDIRRAFIKLSKQLHPDISGKHSHADFVKLNEAYSVLGKESTRRQYDLELKYRCNPYYTYGYSQQTHYTSRWEYEVRKAGRPWPPPNQKSNGNLGLVVALLFFGLGMFQLFFLLHSMKVRKLMLLRNIQIEREYQRTRMQAKKKSIHELETATDLNEYLTEDNSQS